MGSLVYSYIFIILISSAYDGSNNVVYNSALPYSPHKHRFLQANPSCQLAARAGHVMSVSPCCLMLNSRANTHPLHSTVSIGINTLRTVVPGPVEGLNRVPPEIFHYIFEQVKDDKNTLWSSSFVSRRWRELSLPWLFAEIDILSARQFTEFLEFVDIHPRLGAHVHRVNFRPHVHPKLHPPVSEDSLRTFLSSTVSKLPSLRSLSLRDIRVVTDPSPSSTLPPAPVDPERETAPNPHLRHLSIECSVHGQSFWSPLLVWLLSTFAVDTLNLDGVQIPRQDGSDGSAAALVLDQTRNSIQVPNLVMNLYPSSHHDTYVFLEKILRSGSLRSLSLSCTSSSEMARIVRFMGVVGLNVTYLSLDITFFSVSRDGLFGT